MTESNVSWILLIGIILTLSACSPKSEQREWKSEDGYVPNETTAIKIAEAVLPNIYGEGVNDKKPFKASLVNNVWIVEGSLPFYSFGGVPHIEIQKSDGRIINITHGK